MLNSYEGLSAGSRIGKERKRKRARRAGIPHRLNSTSSFPFGGFESNRRSISTVVEYNSTSQKFATHTPLPEPRACSVAAAVDEHRLLVVGGFTNTFVGSCLLYDSRASDRGKSPNVYEVYHTQNEPTGEVTEWSHGRPGTVFFCHLIACHWWRTVSSLPWVDRTVHKLFLRWRCWTWNKTHSDNNKNGVCCHR